MKLILLNAISSGPLRKSSVIPKLSPSNTASDDEKLLHVYGLAVILHLFAL